jgi:hypothetical protein
VEADREVQAQLRDTMNLLNPNEGVVRWDALPPLGYLLEPHKILQ